MYALKSYFLVSSDAVEIVNEIVNKCSDLKKSDAMFVSKKPEQNMQVLELLAPEITADFLGSLKAEFAPHITEVWQDPSEIDFSHVLPRRKCNSFVLPVYGNFQDADCWCEKWKKVSLQVAQEIYPVLVSCHRTQHASWVEIRGHAEGSDDAWFDNVRQICQHFTKSVPTFYAADKLAL